MWTPPHHHTLPINSSQISQMFVTFVRGGVYPAACAATVFLLMHKRGTYSSVKLCSLKSPHASETMVPLTQHGSGSENRIVSPLSLP